MKENLKTEFNLKFNEWNTARENLISKSNDLKNFFNNFIGKSFICKNKKYRIERIIWETDSNIFGGNVEVLEENVNFLKNLLSSPLSYVPLLIFEKNLNNNNFKFEDID